MKENKTYVEEGDRSFYDFRYEDKDSYKVASGLTPDIIRQISREKKDPDWMLEFRLRSLDIFAKTEMPNWGPSIEGLNMDNIVTYVRPNTERMHTDWNDVPEDIKNTFERLGIPQSERESLAGVGAQYDSELVYHNVRKEVAEQGVIYTDLESALRGEYADMIRSHFMKLVPPEDHKFAALHGAVWSGGSFVYVPPGADVEIPLQSYFRLNAPGAGQFEHTLIIVDKGAKLHFIEGCSAPDAPLLHHRELVQEHVQSQHQARQSRERRQDRVGLWLIRIPCLLPLSHERAGRQRGALRIYRRNFRGRGPKSRHRL